ncbi:MAG TPA: hypothetical protein VFG65_06250 [Fimbriimonadales bacterium]|jgi:outer membrane lipoprotein-sorting protein|nr:hypothetical protein [Fimbriimonadales bacterium]
MSIIALAGLAAVLAQSGSGQDLLAKHVAALKDAQSLTVTFTVEHLPAAPETYKLVYSKPGMLRMDYPGGYTMTDGKTVWEYTDSSKEYTEGPGGIAELSKKIGSDEYLGWAAFFMPDQLKKVTDATIVKKLSMKGNPVTQVDFTLDAIKNKVASFYIDDKLGVARAISVRAARGGDSNETLVKASEISLSSSPAAASLFTFAPPAGSKKIEVAASDLSKWYESLDEGLKVAKATNRMVFVDFGAEW